MLYLLGFMTAIVLLLVGVVGWSKWFRVFDGPDGEPYRRRATQGPYAVQVDADDGSLGHPRAHPRHQGR